VDPGVARPDRRDELGAIVAPIESSLAAAHRAREQALPLCRSVIRASGSSIRAVHRHELDRAAALADEAGSALAEAREVLAPFPSVREAGFLHDAAKEYVEARCVAALVTGAPLPGPTELGVDGTAWMRGLAEAASELRRHLLDLLRAGDLARGEELLGVMDDCYDALVVIDYPDAITNGLRRTLDALRAVLERTRGDVTTTVLQTRLQRTIESSADARP
jgi:translin